MPHQTHNPYLMSLVSVMPPVWEESFGASAQDPGGRRGATSIRHMAGRIARLKSRLVRIQARAAKRRAPGRHHVRDRRIRRLERRIARLTRKMSEAGSSNMSQYLYNPFVEMEDEEGTLPGYNPYSEGELQNDSVGDDDEDILADIDPDILAAVEEEVDEVFGSLALDPHYAQMMEEADYGPEGYSEVAMSYMSPVEQVDDLFSPYLIERAGIEDFDIDDFGDEFDDDEDDDFGDEFDDDEDDDFGDEFDDEDDDFGDELDDDDDDGLGVARGRARRSARRSRRGKRQASRQALRAVRQSARQKRRSTRTVARLSKRQSGLEGRRGISSSGPPSWKASAATVTTQAVPSKRGAGGSGKPGPARNYQMTLKLYQATPRASLLEQLKNIWKNPMWKVAPQRRKLPSPESVEAEHGSSNYYY